MSTLRHTSNRPKPEFWAFILSVAILIILAIIFGSIRYHDKANEWRLAHHIEPIKYKVDVLWWEEERTKIYDVTFKDLGAEIVIINIFLPTLLGFIFFSIIRGTILQYK